MEGDVGVEVERLGLVLVGERWEQMNHVVVVGVFVLAVLVVVVVGEVG